MSWEKFTPIFVPASSSSAVQRRSLKGKSMVDLSVEDREKYLSEGFHVARRIIPEMALESVNAEINDLFVTQLKRLKQPVAEGYSREAFRSNATRLLTADVSTYISTARITQMLPSVHRLLISEPIMQLVTGLGIDFPIISTRASIHIMSDELKIPNGYHKTPPHQDWRSIQGSLDNIVLWVPTTPVRSCSHALEIVPKSHLYGLLDTVDHIMTPSTADHRIRDEDFVPLEVEPGDVIAFSAFLVHRTGEEGDGLVRIALSGRFNNAVERTFVEHGFPTPYSYSYRKDLIFEDFPTTKDMRTVFPGAQ